MTEAIRVQGPDGVIVEFPAGTTPDVMKAAMRKKFGGPAQPQPVTPAPLQDLGDPMGIGVVPHAGPVPPEQAGYLPALKKLGGTADDAVRLLADGMTFGFADKLAGYMGGDKEGERKKTKEARERLGYAGIALEIGGSMIPAVRAAKAGMTLMRFAPQAAGAVPGAVRTGLAAGEGAGYGALNALGHDESLGMGALVGAGAGAVGQGIVGALGKAFPALSLTKAPPVRDTIRDTFDNSDDLYRAAERYGVIVGQPGMQRLANEAVADAAQFGYHPALQPKHRAILDALATAAQQPATLKRVDTIRKMAGTVTREGVPSERKLAGSVIGKLDDMVTNPRPGEILSGDAVGAGAAIGEARELWKRGIKAEAVMKAIDKGERRAQVAGSGGNADNTVRQEIRKLREKRDGRGYTPDELAAMDKIMQPGLAHNAGRLIGKLSPHGSGLMAALGLGATAANPMLAIPFAAGAVVKPMADAATRNNAEELARLMLAGGTNVARRAQQVPQQRVTETRDKLLKALIAAGVVAAPSSLQPAQ